MRKNPPAYFDAVGRPKRSATVKRVAVGQTPTRTLDEFTCECCKTCVQVTEPGTRAWVGQVRDRDGEYKERYFCSPGCALECARRGNPAGRRNPGGAEKKRRCPSCTELHTAETTLCPACDHWHVSGRKEASAKYSKFWRGPRPTAAEMSRMRKS